MFPRGKFLIGAAIGSGNTALAAERGGADLLLAINAGRLRNMGAPSIACMLPVLDAATLTDGFAREELLTQCRVPVLLGMSVWEEAFDPAGRARELLEAGFAGAVNFPSGMHFSRPMQQILGRAGRGIETEVAQLRAVQDVGLTSMFYCATRTQARLAADAGLDMVCLNLGWNAGGALGHRRRETLEEVATRARDIGRLIKRINPKIRFFLEGGPIAAAEDLARVVSLAPIDGYVGGSTFERMPLEVSVADQIDRFRQASRRGAELDGDDSRLVNWSVRFGFVGRAPAHLEFLRRLKALSAGREPVLVLSEPGLACGPTLQALGGRETRRGLLEIDVAGEDLPARARSLLFGRDDPASGSLSALGPALGDEGIGLLVLRAAERLPATTQKRLARALKEGSFHVSGSRRVQQVSPRVVLVTEVRDPDSESLKGAGFEEELAALRAGWTLRLQPLRERIEDLPELLEALAEPQEEAAAFSFDAMKLLQCHTWPGNEEELRSLLGGLAGRVSLDRVQPEELRPLLHGDAVGAVPGSTDRGRSEKDRIVDALWRHGFNRTQTAAALGMSRKTLYNKIQRFGLSG